MGNEQAHYYDSDDDDSSEIGYGNPMYSDSESGDVDAPAMYEPPRKLQKTADTGEIEIRMSSLLV
jgi:hypothetical protein